LAKNNSKRKSVADLIWKTPTTLEGIFVAIPYIILNSVGTFLKVLLLSLISILSLNKLIKLDGIWSKHYLKENIVNPWNCVISIVTIILLTIIF
jgi:hypothetical protein